MFLFLLLIMIIKFVTINVKTTIIVLNNSDRQVIHMVGVFVAATVSIYSAVMFHVMKHVAKPAVHTDK